MSVDADNSVHVPFSHRLCGIRCKADSYASQTENLTRVGGSADTGASDHNVTPDCSRRDHVTAHILCCPRQQRDFSLSSHRSRTVLLGLLTHHFPRPCWRRDCDCHDTTWSEERKFSISTTSAAFRGACTTRKKRMRRGRTRMGSGEQVPLGTNPP